MSVGKAILYIFLQYQNPRQTQIERAEVEVAKANNRRRFKSGKVQLIVAVASFRPLHHSNSWNISILHSALSLQSSINFC
jgi:predicted N-formylglutamate amidohydrolase